MIIICVMLVTLISVIGFLYVKPPVKRSKKKRKGCPTCTDDGRCTQRCKKKLGDFY